jgi:hypothetical protein
MPEQRRYAVYVPLRGTQLYLVEASSAAEARRKVNEGSSEGVEPIDSNVTWHGKAGRAVLQPGADEEGASS